MARGIDVSSWQGRIDWTRVKPFIDFAILRCGFGNDRRANDDLYFERNAEECNRLGIPFGVYLYSYATTIDDARSEVDHTLRLIKDKKLEYPVFLDVESRRQMALPKEHLAEIVNFYCEEMEKEGYYVGIYSSLNRLMSNLDSEVLDRYDKWVAEWGDEFTYKKPAGMWQHTAYEELAGIRGRVDGDIAFYDYPKIIRENGLNHLDEKDLKFKRGDRVFVTGAIYKGPNSDEVVKNVCDEEFVIENANPYDRAPYRISEGYVTEDSVYKKCE